MYRASEERILNVFDLLKLGVHLLLRGLPVGVVIFELGFAVRPAYETSFF